MRILKIGGSILTNKEDSSQTAIAPELRRISEEIASVHPDDLILVHGAGSFGHVPAKRYGLLASFNPEGLRLTHSSVARLNQMMVEALSQAGLCPVPVHPLSCVLLRDGRIDSFSQEPVKEMVHQGLMPVLHGDVAMDRTRRSGIVSGDQLVSYLAKSLRAEVVALGSNVDGVLIDGKPLERICREDLPAIESCIGKSAGVDVTGGMKGKLMELLELADAGIGSVIFNAGKKGNIARALRGERVGTRVGRPL